ncbi:MAG: rhomboid family intramembrane serine protease [Patulibacter minatonensis]
MRRRLSTSAALAVAVFAALLVPVALASRGSLDPVSPITGGTGAFIPSELKTSSDGGTAVFTTTEALDPGDEDDRKADLYARWADGSRSLLTPGVNPAGAGAEEFVPWSVRVLADGSVAFLTELPLVPEDTDSARDVYLVHPGGRVELVSAVRTGRRAQNVDADAIVMSADGTTIAFTTIEDLLPSDDEPGEDVYRLAEGNPLELVTVGDYSGWCDGLSDDGTRVYWESGQAQGQGRFPDDDRGQSDLFYASAPYTEVVSPTFPFSGSGSTGGFEPRESPDGSTLVIRTTESMASVDQAADQDSPATPDIYLFARPRSSAPPQLLTSGENIFDQPSVVRVCNGGVVLLRTFERMLSDIDAVADVYRRTVTGAKTLMTPGITVNAATGVDPTVAASADCRTIAWTTRDAEIQSDTDSLRDVYTSTDGLTPQLVSVPPAGRADGPARLLVSQDLGRNLLFTSRAQLSRADVDQVDDVFEWDREQRVLSLVSSATSAAPADQQLLRVTADGDTAFVETNEEFGDDADGVLDIYRYAIEAGADPYPGETVPTPTPGPEVPPATVLATPAADGGRHAPAAAGPCGEHGRHGAAGARDGSWQPRHAHDPQSRALRDGPWGLPADGAGEGRPGHARQPRARPPARSGGDGRRAAAPLRHGASAQGGPAHADGVDHGQPRAGRTRDALVPRTVPRTALGADGDVRGLRSAGTLATAALRRATLGRMAQQFQRPTAEDFGLNDANRKGLVFVAAMGLVMWISEAVDRVALDGDLDAYGVRPRAIDGLDGILFMPFLHGSWDHLIGNTVPFLVLGATIALSGLARVVGVTVVIVLVSGLGTWLTAADNSVTIGASGVVFGYAAYLVVRSYYTRRLAHLFVGLVVLFTWGATLATGLVPTPGVSWQAHLFGAVGGVLAASMWRAPARTAAGFARR